MRGIAWAAGTAAAAVVLAAAAGCGTARYQAAAGHSHGHGRTTAAATPRPPAITRLQAERLARQLLSRAPLPGGARQRTGPPLQALSGPPSAAAATLSVALHELWTVPEPMNVVDTFLTRHVPAGMAWSGSGQTGQAAGVPKWTKPPALPWGGKAPRGSAILEEFVSYQLSRLPAGIGTATLSMAVAPTGPNTSELRADVQVTWYPPRSAAEYVPAGMHAVTITASLLSPRPGSITKTFTSPAVVRRLAAMLNGAHALSLALVPCPLQQVSYRLAFSASRGTVPYLVAGDTGCQTLGITVVNHPQPALQAPPGLGTVLDRLMHIRTVPGTGVLPPPCAKPPRGVWSVPLEPAGKLPGRATNSSCLPVAPAAR